LVDSDQDQICDQDEITGCQDNIQIKTRSATKTKSRAAKTMLLATTMQQLRMQVTAITPKRITIAMATV